MKTKTLLLFGILLLAVSCSKKEETAPPEELGDLQPPFAGRVNASSLLVRSEPSANGPIVGKVMKNRRIDVKAILAKKDTISGKTARWFKVEAEGGVSGYSFGAFIEKAKPGDKLDLPKATKVHKCPDSIHSSFECASYLEKRELPGVRDRVERKGGELRIQCGNGKVLAYKDKPGDSDQVVYYLFQYHYKDVDHFLVLVHLYESLSYILINGANGTTIEIWGEPYYSPDRRRFACASMSAEAFYGPNGIQVYTFDSSSFMRECEMKLDWGPADPVWTDNSRIVLTRYDRVDPGDHLPFEAVLEFRNNKWVVY